MKQFENINPPKLTSSVSLPASSSSSAFLQKSPSRKSVLSSDLKESGSVLTRSPLKDRAIILGTNNLPLTSNHHNNTNGSQPPTATTTTTTTTMTMTTTTKT